MQIRKDRRKFCGCLMPNIFLFLQIGVVLLSYSIILQITTLFHLSFMTVYVFSLIAVGIIAYCVYTRGKILERQYQHCHSEEEKKQNII